MTTTYDPRDPAYLDEADVRGELTRVFDLCHGCRRCVTFCTSFPTLFDLIDAHDDRDAGRLTPAAQDEVVSACFQCKRCHVECPYTPELHEWRIDFPRLMLRAVAMRRARGHMSWSDRVAARFMCRTDRLGTFATRTEPIANAIVTAAPGSVTRKVLTRFTGVSSVRMLAPYAAQRFSKWFRRRPTVACGAPRGTVTVFPTCLLEYQATDIGRDLVAVYERNGFECDATDAGCCGAPWLHAGDVGKFTKVAARNVGILAREVRSGTDIVVPQPACRSTIVHDYPDYVVGPDAELVAAHTYDSSEYLMRLHRGADTSLDTDFTGETIASITYHAPCQLGAPGGSAGRDLMELTGADVTVVQQSSGVGGIWGLRAGNEHSSLPIAARLGDEIERAGGEVVAGDCHLANTVIAEQTGRRPRHPLQVLARAYGIADAP